MNSPAQAIAWQMLRRHRWFVAAELAYLLLAVVVSHLLPALFSRSSLDLTEIPLATQHLCFPMLLIVTHWMSIGQLSSTDSKAIGFPTHMLVLPVRTHSLVAWPLLYAGVPLAGLWLVIAGLILRPTGIPAPLWWPAAALVAGLTIVQALSWAPFTQNWLRIVLAGPLFLMLLAVLVSLLTAGVSEMIITGLLLGVASLFYGLTVAGVACDRRGDRIDWRLAGRVLEWITLCRSPSRQPFASPAAAQLWFEWRGHGWLLPVFMLCALVWPAGLLFLPAEDWSYPWKMLGVMLAMPTLIAGLIGGSLGRQDAWSKYEMTSFLATRPVTTTAIVRAKLLMAALSTAATWLVVLPFVGLVFLRPGFAASVREVAQAIGPAKALAIGLSILAAAVVSTWLSLVQNLWLGLTGRPWIQFLFGVHLGVTIFAGIGIGFWIYLHPAWYPGVQAALPWLLAGLLLAKLTLAIAVLAALARSRLAARTSLAAMVGIWSLVVTGLCLVVYCFVPGEHLALAQAAAGFALAISFSRLAGAPLALAWNRHR